jgi:hypothetical protein
MDSTNNLSSDTHKNSHQCTLSSLCETDNKYEHKHTSPSCVGATGQSSGSIKHESAVSYRAASARLA